MKEKVRVDEQAEARINEIYARAAEKAEKTMKAGQRNTRKKPPTVKRTGNKRSGKKKTK